jgi:hypothetical protein
MSYLVRLGVEAAVKQLLNKELSRILGILYPDGYRHPNVREVTSSGDDRFGYTVIYACNVETHEGNSESVISFVFAPPTRESEEIVELKMVTAGDHCERNAIFHAEPRLREGQVEGWELTQHDIGL